MAHQTSGVSIDEPQKHDYLARVQRRTMVILVISQIVGTVGVGVAPSIGVLLAGEVTENEAWAGLARTASTLGAALLGVPLGILAARKGRRVALTAGWWLAGAGAGALVFAAQWNLVIPLFIGLLLIGSGAAANLQARFVATDLAQPDHKAKSLALVVWVGTLGAVLGPNLGVPGAVVGEVTGLTVYASAFLITSVCLSLAGLIIFVLLRPDPLLLLAQQGEADLPVPSRPKTSRFTMIVAEIRSNRLARIALIAILVAQTVIVSIMTMTPVHMVHHGDTVEIVGITISLHILGMYALAPLVGWVTDRYGHRFTIWMGIGIFMLSLVLGALWPNDTGWIITSLILLGIGWSFVNVAGSALFASSVSDDVRASSQGGVDALANLYGATAAFAAGPLLVISSFATLNVIAMTLLIPLVVAVIPKLVVQEKPRDVGTGEEPA